MSTPSAGTDRPSPVAPLRAFMTATPDPSLDPARPNDITTQSSPPPTDLAVRKKRASRACLRCRSRKVRCDVAQHGAPCTNCRLDSQNCLLSQRLRPPVRQSSGHLDIRMFRQSGNSHTYGLSLAEPRGALPTSVAPTRPTPDVAIRGAQQDDHMQERQPQLETPFPQRETHSEPLMQQVAAERDRPGDADIFASSDFLDDGGEIDGPEQSVGHSNTMNNDAAPNNHVPVTSYTFLDLDFMHDLQSDDFDYLRQSGCFHLPDRQYLEDLLRAYFLYVHHGLPLVDEEEFWAFSSLAGFPGRSTSHHIPLILLQAMLLVASSVSLLHQPLSIISFVHLGFRAYQDGMGQI